MQATTAPRPPARLRRAVRRTVRGVTVLLVVITAMCWVFNRITDGAAEPPSGLTFVQTGDIRTRVTTAGHAGPAVVLVPGAAESADTWAPVARGLAAGHRVVAYDVVGWGYTQRRGPYDLDAAVRQLLALVDALGLRRPVFVGHSSGAGVIVEAALRAPDRVGGLVLLDGDALDTGAGARSPARLLVLPPYRTTALRLALGSDTLVRRVYDRQCGPRCPALDAAGVDGWRRPFRVAGAEPALWAMLDVGVLGVPVRRLEQVADLDVPKAVVFGADDDVFTPQAPAQTAARIGAPAPTIIPAGRHLTLVSDPGPVAAAVARVARAADGTGNADSTGDPGGTG